MKLPGFLNEEKLNETVVSYLANSSMDFVKNSSIIIPQLPRYRARVGRYCGPCRNRKKTCFLTGYECTVEPGAPGSDYLRIPPGPGYVRCEPTVFESWQISC